MSEMRMRTRTWLASGAVIAAGVALGGVAVIWTRSQIDERTMSRYETRLRGWLAEGEQCLAGRQRAELGPYNGVFDNFVALEDRTFWTRKASVELRSLLRAAWSNVLNLRAVEGASGVPQQLATLAMAAEDGAWHRHGVGFKLYQFELARRVFGDYSRGAFEVAILDHLPCGPVDGARACAVLLFERELSGDLVQVSSDAAVLAAQARAPGRLHRDTSALASRARYASEVLRTMGAAGRPLTLREPVLSGDRSRSLAGDLRGRSVCERASSPEIDIVRSAVARGISVAQARLQDRAPGIMVIGAALVGDDYVSVAGRWDQHGFEGGSWAKVWALKAIAELGPEYREFVMRVRLADDVPLWDFNLDRWRPGSVGRLDGPATMLESVVRSHNQSTLNYLVYFPYWLDPPRLDALLDARISPAERARFRTLADRQHALEMLTKVSGFPYTDIPEQADESFSYRPLLLLSLRLFREAMEKDLDGIRVPEVPAAVLGAGTKAEPRRWLGALRSAWFAPGGGCTLTATGELLADAMADAGTLHQVVEALGIVAPAKTGTTEHTAQAALGLCVVPAAGRDEVPMVVAVWAFYPDWKPVRLQGAHLGAAITLTVQTAVESGLLIAEPKPHEAVQREIAFTRSEMEDTR